MAITLLLTICCNMNAMPAYRGVLKHTQPDGTVLTYYLRGDENCHGYFTTDGHILCMNDSNALCYATLNESGKITATRHMAHDVPSRDTDEKSFAAKTGIISMDGLRKAQISTRSYSTASARKMSVTRATTSSAPLSSFPTIGNLKGLILLVEFSDNSFYSTHTQTVFNNEMNQAGYSDFDGTGSAKDYFTAQSSGAFTPTFDVIGPIKLSHPISYYGKDEGGQGYDIRPEYMVGDACKKASDSLNVDFSQYDFNNDGYVDFVYVIYAGYGQADGGPSSTIWPHAWALSASSHYSRMPLVLNGKTVDAYACSNELKYGELHTLNGIGTFCHEFSHVLGLPDLYQTGGENLTNLPGEWDILDYGPYNNGGHTPPAYSAFERYSLGWLTPTVIDKTAATKINLPELTANNKAYIIHTALTNEYYFLESRQQVGWDAYLPGKGMMITHIDYDADAWNNNVVNDSAGHPRVDILEADGTVPLKGVWGDGGDLYPGINNNTSFTSASSPSAIDWEGNYLGVSLLNIANDESTGIVSFTTYIPKKLSAPSLKAATAVTDTSFVISWDAVEGATSYTLKLIVGTDTTTISGITDNSYTIKGLSAGTNYTYIVKAISSEKGFDSDDTKSDTTTAVSTGIDDISTSGIQPYTIFDLSGRIVTSGSAESDKVIPLPTSKGIYIISYGKERKKVLVP